jgi:hypothetical protein
MAFFAKSALILGLPPAILTLSLLSLALWASKRGKRELSRWITGAAIAVGYVLGHRIATGLLTLIPHSSEQWLPLLALTSLFLSLIDLVPRVPVWARLTWRTLLGLAVSGALLFPVTFLTASAKVAWVLSLGILFSVVCFCLDALAEREPKAWLPFTWSLVAMAGSASFLIAHSAIVSQLSGVLASVSGATFIFAAWRKDWSVDKSATAVFATILFGLGINGAFYADLPIISAILLWLSLLAGWIRFVPFVRQLPNWAQTIASICVALLIAALGVGFAVHKLGLPSGGY